VVVAPEGDLVALVAGFQVPPADDPTFADDKEGVAAIGEEHPRVPAGVPKLAGADRDRPVVRGPGRGLSEDGPSEEQHRDTGGDGGPGGGHSRHLRLRGVMQHAA
jgi:hypothetical protein